MATVMSTGEPTDEDETGPAKSEAEEGTSM